MWLENMPQGLSYSEDMLTGNAMPVLKEISTLLEQLRTTGEGGIIDLSSLPFSPADREWLLNELGEGAVKISIDAGGPTTIDETATPGVWWVVHRNENNAKVGEFIEITLIPEIVPTNPDDVSTGAKKLEEKLNVY